MLAVNPKGKWPYKLSDMKAKISDIPFVNSLYKNEYSLISNLIHGNKYGIDSQLTTCRLIKENNGDRIDDLTGEAFGYVMLFYLMLLSEVNSIGSFGVNSKLNIVWVAYNDMGFNNDGKHAGFKEGSQRIYKERYEGLLQC